MRLLLSTLILTLISGCVPFPTYKTLQPSTTAKVTDRDGEPIDDAKVELIISSYPYGSERFRVIRRTNPVGEAEFTKINEWRIEMPLMLHGVEVFFWNLCVSKSGYATLQTYYTGSDEFQKEPVLVLYPGESTQCSEPLE
jgi:hypothetical protein